MKLRQRGIAQLVLVPQSCPGLRTRFQLVTQTTPLVSENGIHYPDSMRTSIATSVTAKFLRYSPHSCVHLRGNLLLWSCHLTRSCLLFQYALVARFNSRISEGQIDNVMIAFACRGLYR